MSLNKIKWKTMDGNAAAAHVAYAFTETAAIYPITPSSPMAEYIDEWSVQGRKNIFGQRVKIVEMQSEGGASGAVHGALQSGSLSSTFTASQGLLLMIPNMYKIAGELLPGVFHVSARTLSSHALSIFGDHGDVMATRQTGFALLAEGGVQEVMDLSPVAHLSAIKGRIPFLSFFDGFRTSHEIQKIRIWDYDDLAKMVDYEALRKFQKNALNPEHPVTRGTTQNPDIFFQQKEASNKYYLRLPEIVEDYMQQINSLIGTDYHLFNYYGSPEADRMIIAMGSVCDTIEETVDYLNNNGEKVGVLKVHLYRPFSLKHFFKYIPETVKKIAVLDRTKEAGSLGEPLYTDVTNAYFRKNRDMIIVGGRYGLGSKDTTSSQIAAVYDSLRDDSPKNGFTIGIVDDMTHTSLPITRHLSTVPEGTKQCKFWGLGSDGTVGANKSAIKIIGDHTDMYVQGYFSYDSKKSGGITISHLRFGKKPIKSTYLINSADYVACHNQAYVYKYNVLDGIKDGGTFLLNTIWDGNEVDEKLPAAMKKYIAEHNIKFYTVNAVKIAQEIGLGGRINMIMQSAFFTLAKIIPVEDATRYLKEAIADIYGRKGENVVRMNQKAVDSGAECIVRINVPKSWADAKMEEKTESDRPDYIKNIVDVMNRQEGDLLPVSSFVGMEDGTFQNGAAAYEKRGVAVNVPEWQPERCIQCNQCSYVCSHAVIRPILLDEGEVQRAPKGMKFMDAKGGKKFDGYKFSMAVSALDCTGCGSCADVCPRDALVMKPIDTQTCEQEKFDYAIKLPVKNPIGTDTVKGSQFEQPLLEFSGACGGCGETPYMKLITQLFGDRMLIANASGCSSAWSGSTPSTPYTVNAEGHGPAWAMSLFEDNAEYGYGMYVGINQTREKMKNIAEKAMESDISSELKVALREWIKNMNSASESKAAKSKIMPLLEKEKYKNDLTKELFNLSDFFIKKSQWLFGGDGWAYDIGYGGLDHVLATGEDVNVLVVDTEVYSNTGGQSSKATPSSAIAKFASGGKRTKKKDLGLMAMTYGYVYVAQICMGADKNQTLKAIREAEAYEGPSLIIAYAPCINHGLKCGMNKSQEEGKRAVECGYWPLYRFNPALKAEGKNPFILDSKEPDGDFKNFLLGEVRYASLKKILPDKADEMYTITERDARERLDIYKKLAK
ncbi:pyruvate:ferredoxin (flavodoxin) oxidoreductase [Clostridium sp. WLY-B-L2]|uniref:Pyruvate:ferredoxin oxidoreductase n=1 Tax=Clostridium aromativorans TaxID=2836848 RepID=A0ABS8N9P8_9CLOT|nr:pyruvate:ferredoxin (flavodoxin) oxidoreductase [Clostridium aromativorans]MCC9296552.1 pyruvate:ferredoxin (flavodoxin) oxidoreductase [Clostridium aromativorans]